jgi:2-oxoglutarate dehydrogenase complex dehydrogenase (E1) component-like enzyme
MIKALNFLKNSYRLSYSKAMYEAWKSNPADVHEDWDIVFKSASASGSEETSPNL